MFICFTVANVILELTVTRSGLYSVLVSWTPSSGDTAKVTGYILYYQQHGGRRFQISLAASDNSTTVKLPTLGVTYIFTIVATSIHLPSPESDPVMFTMGTFIHNIFILSVSNILSISLQKWLSSQYLVRKQRLHLMVKQWLFRVLYM